MNKGVAEGLGYTVLAFADGSYRVEGFGVSTMARGDVPGDWVRLTDPKAFARITAEYKHNDPNNPFKLTDRQLLDLRLAEAVSLGDMTQAEADAEIAEFLKSPPPGLAEAVAAVVSAPDFATAKINLQALIAPPTP